MVKHIEAIGGTAVISGPGFEVRRAMRLSRAGLLAVAGFFIALCGNDVETASAGDETKPVTLFAAASTTNVVNALIAAFEGSGGGRVRPVYASSSTLARQIAQGAPADLFLSANVAWMDYLEKRDLLTSGTRVELFGNRLVLIVPAHRAAEIAIEPRFALAELIGEGRLVLGDPAHVPAGIYAKAALEHLGVWDAVAGKLAFAPDVRGALAMVERGEANAGIVYATDAAISRGVAVAGIFPEESHPRIRYPIAVIAGSQSSTAAAFMTFLSSPAARAVFRAHGFDHLNAEG
jgi:molybdate transport system substrate-binding protein